MRRRLSLRVSSRLAQPVPLPAGHRAAPRVTAFPAASRGAAFPGSVTQRLRALRRTRRPPAERGAGPGRSEPRTPPRSARSRAAERPPERSGAARGPPGAAAGCPRPTARGPSLASFAACFAALETFWRRKPGVLRSAFRPGSGRSAETKRPPAPTAASRRRSSGGSALLPPLPAVFSLPPSPRPGAAGARGRRRTPGRRGGERGAREGGRGTGCRGFLRKLHNPRGTPLVYRVLPPPPPRRGSGKGRLAPSGRGKFYLLLPPPLPQRGGGRGGGGGALSFPRGLRDLLLGRSQPISTRRSPDGEVPLPAEGSAASPPARPQPGPALQLFLSRSRVRPLRRSGDKMGAAAAPSPPAPPSLALRAAAPTRNNNRNNNNKKNPAPPPPVAKTPPHTHVSENKCAYILLLMHRLRRQSGGGRRGRTPGGARAESARLGEKPRAGRSSPPSGRTRARAARGRPAGPPAPPAGDSRRPAAGRGRPALAPRLPQRPGSAHRTAAAGAEHSS